MSNPIPPNDQKQRWWLSQQGNPTGPYDADFIVNGLRAGRIPPDTYACIVGGQVWKMLSESQSFVAAYQDNSSLFGDLTPDFDISVAQSTSQVAANSNDIARRGQLRQELKVLQRQVSKYNWGRFGFFVPGLVLTMLSNAFTGDDASKSILALLGYVLMGIGVAFEVRRRGRHPAWTLAGLFACFGLLIIALLPNLLDRRISDLRGALIALGESPDL